MKKKRTYEQIREAARRSTERAAEETERLSSMKPDIITPISRARWNEQPATPKRSRKKRISNEALLNAIMIVVFALIAVPITITLNLLR